MAIVKKIARNGPFVTSPPKVSQEDRAKHFGKRRQKVRPVSVNETGSARAPAPAVVRHQGVDPIRSAGPAHPYRCFSSRRARRWEVDQPSRLLDKHGVLRPRSGYPAGIRARSGGSKDGASIERVPTGDRTRCPCGHKILSLVCQFRHPGAQPIRAQTGSTSSPRVPSLVKAGDGTEPATPTLELCSPTELLRAGNISEVNDQRKRGAFSLHSSTWTACEPLPRA